MADSSSFVPVRKRPRRLENEEEDGHNQHQHQLNQELDDHGKRHKPIAPTIHKFLCAGGTSFYRPRPEWLRIPNNLTVEQEESTSAPSTSCSTFGRDQDTALILAIRENATEAALSLIAASVMEPRAAHASVALIEKANTKGITPLMLAAQKGNATILRAILRHGVDPAVTSANGTSALLQAAHFGHAECCSILLQCAGRALTELANSNSTTPLMRAAQEGHFQTVKLLLQYTSHHHVNRQNASQMSALMLAAQRGHTRVCQLLIDDAQALVDLKTNQDSTALLLACKRGHVDVVRILVTAGCELCVRDSRGRTAQRIAQRRNHNSTSNNSNSSNNDTTATQHLLELLDPSVQVLCMQRAAAARRNFDMIRLWRLLQANRASVILDEYRQHTASIHTIPQMMRQHNSRNNINSNGNSNSSTHALLRCLTLPAPLVQAVTQFLPRPKLWDQRIAMLTTSRSFINPNASANSALDLLDEILEEGGFLEACDECVPAIPPPSDNYSSWCDWKRRRVGCVRAAPRSIAGPRERPNACTDQVPPPVDPENPTVLELRHQAGYLQVLARHEEVLGRILRSSPYRLPSEILHKLTTVSDLASCLRRLREGFTLDAPRALDLVLLASQLCSWYWRERQ